MIYVKKRHKNITNLYWNSVFWKWIKISWLWTYCKGLFILIYLYCLQVMQFLNLKVIGVMYFEDFRLYVFLTQILTFELFVFVPVYMTVQLYLQYVIDRIFWSVFWSVNLWYSRTYYNVHFSVILQLKFSVSICSADLCIPKMAFSMNCRPN